jgi:hypothetical protein
MRSEDTLFIFLAVIIGVPIGLWFYQDNIFGFMQTVDLTILKTLSMLSYLSPIPLVGEFFEDIGGYFGRWAQAYGDLTSSQLKFQHTWMAGNTAWRPLVIIIVLPMMAQWAWKSRKTRRAQSFTDMTKGFLDTHLKSPQTSKKASSRQQWTVRRWLHFYGVHELKWGSARWHRRMNLAFQQQLGVPSSDEAGAALVDEFATFIYREVERQFGEKNAKLLPVDILKNEAKSQHAYVSTAMVRVLAAARDQFGALSPNRFRNRLLQDSATVPIWFALNGFGRQTTHIESLAILSHFYEEVSKGEAIPNPQFDNAYAGLEQYRNHHVGRRKLKDLDESEKINADRARAEKEAAPKKAPITADARYQRKEQLIK